MRSLLASFPDVFPAPAGMSRRMGMKSRTSDRMQLDNETHKGAVRLQYDSEARTWLLMAFRKDASALADDTLASKNDQIGSSGPEAAINIVKDASNVENIDGENKGIFDPAGPRILHQSQAGRGGRSVPVTVNADAVLQPVAIADAARANDRQIALAMLANTTGQYQTASGEAVTISRASRKIFSGTFPPGRLRLAGAIPELLQSSVVYNADTPQRAYAVAGDAR